MGRRLTRTEGSRPGWKLRGKRGEGELEGRVFTDLLQDPKAGFSRTPGKVFAGNTSTGGSYKKLREAKMREALLPQGKGLLLSTDVRGEGCR